MNKDWEEKLHATASDEDTKTLGLLTEGQLLHNVYNRFIREVIIPETFQEGVNVGLDCFKPVNISVAQYSDQLDKLLESKLGK